MRRQPGIRKQRRNRGRHALLVLQHPVWESSALQRRQGVLGGTDTADRLFALHSADDKRPIAAIDFY
jgi:hypothetical protein